MPGRPPRGVPPSTTNDGAGWGLLDVFGWYALAQVGSVLWITTLFGPLSGLADFGARTEPSILAIFLGAFVMWFAYGVGPLITASTRGDGPVVELGASVRPLDVPVGFALGIFVSGPVMSGLYFVILRFVDGDPASASQGLADRVDGPADTLLFVLMAGVAAPLVEELFFRGLLLRALCRRFDTWIAVVVQAVLFAAVHLQGLQFPGLLVVGLVTGLLAVRTGRLGPCWAMHAGFNGLSLALLLL